MKARRLWTILILSSAVLPVRSQATRIGAGEAKSLVHVVLRHEKIHLSPHYCSIERLDKDGKPFVPNYYSFSVTCDFPNAAATTPFGIYVVSPRNGNVWEFNRCVWFRFAELSRLQEGIASRTHATERSEAKYREGDGMHKGQVMTSDC